MRFQGVVLCVLIVGFLAMLATSDDICLLPKKIGRCKAAFPRWWYNVESRKCEMFSFGGCQPNANNFMTEEECIQACDNLPRKCNVPPAAAPCPKTSVNYFYNKKTGKCEKFSSGLCGKNENMFPWKTICKWQCEHTW